MSQKTLSLISATLLGIVLCGFIIFEAVLNLTPPVARDVLIHHLAVPRLWLAEGRIHVLPWAEFSYYPMNINLLYLGCLYLGTDIAPKFIHMAFGLGTALLVFRYLSLRLGRPWGLLGAVIFFTTPLVVWLSTSAYIDLGLTFFTTASLLSILKWRDSGYNHSRWLILAAVSMGLALGSKYNALIACFITGLLLMFMASRETRNSWISIRSGLIFFALAGVVASPWLIRNAMLTGNPLYPLFDQFFSILSAPAADGLSKGDAVGSIVTVHHYQMRKILYNESLVETLLIPLRMFFQGQDDSYQYFQGVLNPILIVFIPFLFLERRYYREVLFFAVFIVFFMTVSFFQTLSQVRYILPTIPFFAILAVLGIHRADQWVAGDIGVSPPAGRAYARHSLRAVIWIVVALLIGYNGRYLAQRVEIVRPFSYIAGKESRKAFLDRTLEHHKAIGFINSNLPEDAVVFTIFLGRRGYYLERSYRNDGSFGAGTIDRLMNASAGEETFGQSLAGLGVSHLFMRNEVFFKYLKDNYSPEQVDRFLNLFVRRCTLLYDASGYSVWKIRTDDAGQRPGPPSVETE